VLEGHHCQPSDMGTDGVWTLTNQSSSKHERFGGVADGCGSHGDQTVNTSRRCPIWYDDPRVRTMPLALPTVTYRRRDETVSFGCCLVDTCLWSCTVEANKNVGILPAEVLTLTRPHNNTCVCRPSLLSLAPHDRTTFPRLIRCGRWSEVSSAFHRV
jgi:hypothetical protein